MMVTWADYINNVIFDAWGEFTEVKLRSRSKWRSASRDFSYIEFLHVAHLNGFAATMWGIYYLFIWSINIQLTVWNDRCLDVTWPPLQRRSPTCCVASLAGCSIKHSWRCRLVAVQYVNIYTFFHILVRGIQNPRTLIFKRIIRPKLEWFD